MIIKLKNVAFERNLFEAVAVGVIEKAPEQTVLFILGRPPILIKETYEEAIAIIDAAK